MPDANGSAALREQLVALARRVHRLEALLSELTGRQLSTEEAVSAPPSVTAVRPSVEDLPASPPPQPPSSPAATLSGARPPRTEPGLESRIGSQQALVLVAVAIAKVFVYDVSQLDRVYRILRNEGRETVAAWEQPEHAPLDRVAVEVGGETNFRRDVELEDAEERTIARGEIKRVKIAITRSHSNQSFDTEKLELELTGARSTRFKLIIHNGDDPPLPITQVQPFSVQRRIYFDPRSRSTLKLYCGDDKARARSTTTRRPFNSEPTQRAPSSAPTSTIRRTPDVPTTGRGRNDIRHCCGRRSSSPSSDWARWHCVG